MTDDLQPPAARADGPAPLNRYDLCDEIRQGGHYGEEQWTERIMRSCEGGPWVAYADVAAALAEVATLKEENRALQRTYSGWEAFCSEHRAKTDDQCPRCQLADLRAEVATLHQAHQQVQTVLLRFVCPECIEDHARNTQSVSCYCRCHSSRRDDAIWQETVALAGLARRAARPQPAP